MHKERPASESLSRARATWKGHIEFPLTADSPLPWANGPDARRQFWVDRPSKKPVT